MKSHTNSKGSVIFTVLFVFFISMVGLSLMTFCVTHTRIVKARSIKTIQTDQLYRAVIYYLHQFRENVFNRNIQEFAQPELDYFNTFNFPGVVIDNRYSFDHSFSFVEFPGKGYKKTRVISTVDASIDRYPYRYRSGIFIDILCGKVPLTSIPLFVDKNVDKSMETFLNDNRIVNKSAKNMVIGNTTAELNISEFLLGSLKLSGSALTWRKIREKLTLPLSDDPILEGIYLLVENGNVETIVIQGNVEQLIFLADSRFRTQKIRIIKNSIPYELSYKPGEKYFMCWDSSIPYTSMFKQKFIVNGDVASIEQEGDAAFLDNSDITLFVSGKAIIRSNLESEPQNLTTKKLDLSNLKLSCGKDQLFNGGSEKSEIVVINKDSAVIRASLIVKGKFTNNSSKLKLSGSLYCTDLENNGVMEIDYLQASTSGENNFCTTDFKYIDRFLIQFIEEVSDGD